MNSIVVRKTVIKTKSLISKKSMKNNILQRGNGNEPIVISAYSNREIKKKITSKTKSNFLFLDLVGSNPKKVYLLFNLHLNCDILKIQESINKWKLWKTECLEEYMGTSEYDIVTRKGYLLDWVLNKEKHFYPTEKERFPGTSFMVPMLRLVPSTSVVSPILNAECRACKLPKKTFFKLDNIHEFIHKEECSKVLGTCSDCVHVEELKFKTPVVCSKCKNEVNVLGLAPGCHFRSGLHYQDKCVDCIVSGFCEV